MPRDVTVLHTKPTTWRVLCIACVAIALGLVQVFVLRGDSVTTDENSYLFQARVFAHARLWAPLPPEGRLFAFDFSMINVTEDHWFSRYPFGHPLALVPGVLAGYPLLMPFLFGLGSLMMLHTLARQAYSARTADVAMVLMGGSPFFLAVHSTLLSHTTAMFALLMFVVGCAKASDSRDLRWGALAGMGLGLALNARPWTSLLMAWPFLGWLAWSWITHRSTVVFRQLLVIGGLVVSAVGAYHLYNRVLTGDWWLTPYHLYNPTERLGFVYVRMMELQHTAAHGVDNTVRNLQRLNHWWLGVPYSLPVLGFLPFQRPKTMDVLLVLAGVSLIGGHYFFYFRGIQTVGPVYYFELLIPLSVLGARSLIVAWEFVRRRSTIPNGLRTGVVVFALAVWLGSLGHFWQGRIPSIERELAPQRAAAAAVADGVVDGAIVFFGDRRPEWQAVRYEPFSPNDVVYMWTNGDRYQRIMDLYPTRPAYLYEAGELSRLR